MPLLRRAAAGITNHEFHQAVVDAFGAHPRQEPLLLAHGLVGASLLSLGPVRETPALPAEVGPGLAAMLQLPGAAELTDSVSKRTGPSLPPSCTAWPTSWSLDSRECPIGRLATSGACGRAPARAEVSASTRTCSLSAHS